MQVHLLYVGNYEDRTVVGVYATRGAAEAEIVRRAFEGDDLTSVSVEEYEVQGT